MILRTRVFFRLLRDAFVSWRKDNPALIAAGLSFYAVFSLAPLMIIGISIARHLFQITYARDILVTRIADVFSPDAAQSIGYLFKTMSKKFNAITFLSAFLLLWGGIGIFAQLQSAIDLIWGFEAFPEGIRPTRVDRVRFQVVRRFRALFTAAAFGAILFGFFVIDIGLNGFGRLLLEYFPADYVHRTIPLSSHLCSFAVLTTAFALVYKFLPNVRIDWGDVWVGAVFTAALFACGRFAITLYLRHADMASLYGAAGSVLATLIWIYFSMNTLLFGAEFTWVYAHRNDDRALQQHVELRVSA